ncbi:hypothetical protein QZH41_011828 [Actinostola sp. cb2023]|nr:hypothetical protein QZH41_011828 [Actinostola sp. cb2023]
MNPNFNAVGQSFQSLYYSSFDSNRATLREVYRSSSMLTFEGDQFQGQDAITQKLTSLPFKVVQHVITTVDCQPAPNNGVLVFVVGQLKTDNDPPNGFNQAFLLMPSTGTEGYYVLNDIFRLSALL